jgi:hypothetical protein
MTHLRSASGTLGVMEHGCGFDRSQLCSDEAPPIGNVSFESWTEVAFPVIARLLRWN